MSNAPQPQYYSQPQPQPYSQPQPGFQQPQPGFQQPQSGYQQPQQYSPPGQNPQFQNNAPPPPVQGGGYPQSHGPPDSFQSYPPGSGGGGGYGQPQSHNAPQPHQNPPPQQSSLLAQMQQQDGYVGQKYDYEAPSNSEKVYDDKYSGKWENGMLTIPCKEPVACFLSCVCPWCCVFIQRKKLLQDDWSRYRCCQGIWGKSYTNCTAKFSKGKEPVCLCMESLFCLSCATHANRYMVQQHYHLQHECCDLVIMYLSCFCSILACLCQRDELRLIADCIYYITIGCMLAQHEHQMKTLGYPRGKKNVPASIT